MPKARSAKFTGSYLICIGGKHVGANMGMQSHQVQFLIDHDPVDGIPCISVFIVESKSVPHGIYPGIHVHPYGHLGSFPEFSEMAMMEYISSKWSIWIRESFSMAFFKILIGLIRTIENNLASFHAIIQGFIIFKSRYHLGPGSFLVKNTANGIQVIGFVGPCKLDLRVPGGKCMTGFLIFLPDGFFGNYIER